MRMVGHRRAPGMHYGSGTDAGTEVLGIGGNGEQSLGRNAEQQVVNYHLVLVGDWGDRGRQGEDHMEIADRQQISLACSKPVPCHPALTLGTMAVATRVVGDPAVAAILAALDMAAESSRAATLDRRHRLELAEAEVPSIGSAPGRPVAMEDVCDLQPRAAHRPPDYAPVLSLSAASSASRSSGLVTVRIVVLATRV